MNVTVNDVGACKKLLRVEVPEAKVDATLAEVERDYQKHAALPGFRKGKAPAALAQEVVSAFKPNAYLAQARAAGPFVNFSADRSALYRHLFTGAKNQALVPKTVGSGKRILRSRGLEIRCKPLLDPRSEV